MDKPLVSIIMTTHNPVEEYLEYAIESIINQTYTNWELIIFDDGSQKEVKNVVEKFQDNRIVTMRCEVNRGISACANDAIAVAKGSFFAKIDDDDIAYENWLERMITCMMENTTINALGCVLKLIGTKQGYEKKPLAKTREQQQAGLLIQNAAIAHSLCVFRRSMWEKNKLQYDTRYKSAIDYALWVQMVKYTKFHMLQEILGVYRRHEKQISTKTYSAQQNYADEIRWNQLRQIGIEPNDMQKKIHNKLCRIEEIDSETLKELNNWVALIKKQNKKNPYFNPRALRSVLHQRTATLYLRYLEKTHDVRGVFYFIKYATLQNVKNGIVKIMSHKG